MIEVEDVQLPVFVLVEETSEAPAGEPVTIAFADPQLKVADLGTLTEGMGEIGGTVKGTEVANVFQRVGVGALEKTLVTVVGIR